MAFIPVATAWVSEFWWMRAPVYFYLVVYTIWDFAYFLLTRIIYEDNVVKDPQGAAKLRKSKSYSKATKIIHLCLFAIGYIGIYFYPPIGIGVILSEAVIWYLNVPKEETAWSVKSFDWIKSRVLFKEQAIRKKQ